MALTITTGLFREAAARAAHLGQNCRWWVLEARLVTLGDQTNRLSSAVVRVERVADRSEQLARELSAMADRYDDHEAQVGRLLEPLAVGAVIYALAPWLPFGAVALEALIDSGVVCREAPVTVTHTATRMTTAPQGVDSLLARVPQDSDQVRIDAIDRDGAMSYVVYISGTRDFSPVAGGEPWDLTSGFHALRGEDESGCERAVRAAMEDAGIAHGDDVVFVGHSLGGLTAMRIAESGDFAVSDVLTAGAPIHKVSLDASTRVTVLEHTDDLIPAVSGVAVATSAVTIRSAFGRSTTGMWGAHNLSSYRSTAREIDLSSDPVLVDRRTSLERATQGERANSRWYRATRSTD